MTNVFQLPFLSIISLFPWFSLLPTILLLSNQYAHVIYVGTRFLVIGIFFNSTSYCVFKVLFHFGNAFSHAIDRLKCRCVLTFSKNRHMMIAKSCFYKGRKVSNSPNNPNCFGCLTCGWPLYRPFAS